MPTPRKVRGGTALHVAVCYDRVPLVGLLLRAGADVDAKARGSLFDPVPASVKKRALKVAEEKGYKDIVGFWRKAGAKG